MRLIDAEDIPYTMLYKENWMKGTGEEAQGAWKSDIDKMPTIDATPVVHAHLIKPDPYGECSNCGYLIDIRQEYNYCPNCGAKMDGGEE